MNPEKTPSGKYEQLELNLWPSDDNIQKDHQGTEEDFNEQWELIEKSVDQGVGSYYGCEQRISPDKSRKPSPYDHQTNPWLSEEQVARNAKGAAAVRAVVRAKIPLSPAVLRARKEKRSKRLRNPYC